MQSRAALPLLLLLLCLLAQLILHCECRSNALKHMVTISDPKEWKKLLRTRKNVLGLFSNGEDSVSDFLPIYDRVAGKITGMGTLVYIDCSSKDSKKLCKQLKVKPSLFEMKHYKDGVFHKDYDRLLQEKSLLQFMEDPASGPPWSEDPIAKDVRHVDSPHDFEKLLKKEKKPILTMFYAPWCGHCKQLKPEFAAAASELKKKAVLAGMDVDKPDAYGIRQELNITGFPTLLYFQNGQKKFTYSGGRDKDGIIEWMKDPKPPEVEPEVEEQPWSEVVSDVVHLLDDTFDSFVSENPSVLVMFYAPWCGHCKAMKPHYMEAATVVREQGIEGVLAAVDATKATAVADRYKVEGFPTLKYFKAGEMVYEYGFGRTTDDIVEFMRDPKEPPPPEPDWTEIESEVEHLTDEDFKPFLKKKKHALVMFYTPWCPHCKAAKPDYMEAAERFKEDKKTAFAAIDCTKFRSFCKLYEVAGYPTFKYFSYGKKEHKYMGGRDTEGFYEFMADPAAYIHDEL